MDQPQPLHRSVAERLVAEGLVLVVKAANDAGVSISTKTAIRWCLNGVRGVRLESVKVSGRRMTSRPAFTRFVAATQPQVEGRSKKKPATMGPQGCRDVGGFPGDWVVMGRSGERRIRGQ